MECNKEEAIKAKGIAESKMQIKDFCQARKFALRAQQLYQDLDNISQMLVVCDVHCAAEKKLFGNEMDWYGILKVEQTADEAIIKKQYRKFALQLHPDKNNFPGAEAAFKLIGEAQAILLDKGKRSLHDIKRKAFTSKPAPSLRPPHMRPNGATYNPHMANQNTFSSNFTSFNAQHQQSQQAAGQHGFSSARATFWTACPFCNVKYQYYIETIHKFIVCQTCKKSFVAYERTMQEMPTGTTFNQQQTNAQKKGVPDQSFTKVQLGRQGNFSTANSNKDFVGKKDCNSEFTSNKVHGKRRRKVEEESSESCDSESTTGSEDDNVVDEDVDFKAAWDFECHGERLRRSDRHKQHVSYKENMSDEEDFENHSEKAKGNASSCATKKDGETGLNNASKMDKYPGLADDVKDQIKVTQEESLESLSNEMKESKNVKEEERVDDCRRNSEIRIDSASGSPPELYAYPDPEFNDFDKSREGIFHVGQIWAMYDTLDAMPRYYARVRRVFSSFKLQINWLEPDPVDEDQIEWVNAGLPASCGEFRNGDLEYTEDRLMFSHMVYWGKGSQRDTYKIFPRKGEAWALFKNWDTKWKSHADIDRKYEYEFVEILSEYREGVGAIVAYLGKVKGFVSLFCQIRKDGKAAVQIPPGELFRFSHMVPSFKLTGEERDGVPKGSLELDPASLPKNIEEISVPEDLGIKVDNCHTGASCSRSSPKKVKTEFVSGANTSMHQSDMNRAHLESEDDSVHVVEDRSPSLASTPESIEIPEPEFFNFDAEKSIEKFQAGQIWSLYCDEDGLPKYYGQIIKVDIHGIELCLRWLIACPLSCNIIHWDDEAMPISCGRFKLKRGGSGIQFYTSTGAFSHQLTVVPINKTEFSILPKKGQIWALYKKWSAEIKLSDLENCEYDIVEVLEENVLSAKVAYLERVNGFNSVFKARVEGGSAVTREIPSVELLRFSHEIPAFQLTEQRGGSLRGHWELDPAALPLRYFTIN